MKLLLGLLAAAVVAVGAVLVFSGGDPDGAPTTITTQAESVTTGPAVTSTTTPAVASCALEGMWRLQDQSFFDAVMALSPGEGEFEYLSGDYFIEFRSGGVFLETRNAWRFRVTSADGVIEVETDGETPGTWTAADAGAFEIVASEGTLTGSMWIVEGGTLVPLPVGGTIGVPGVVGLGTYDCADGSLVLHIAADDGPFTVTFDRVG